MISARSSILPHLDADHIVDIYRRAPGDEVTSGKFDSPESSAALAANTFGAFLGDASYLPALPHLERLNWNAESVELEAVIRLPWSGGRHPCLDALVRTPDALIGIESKRYEPYRTKEASTHSAAYQRDVWGKEMKGYCALWSSIVNNDNAFDSLDAAQLIKHAFAIRTQVHRSVDEGRQGILYYLYADPECWPDGQKVDATSKELHYAEIRRFSQAVERDEVQFVACSYRELLGAWQRSQSDSLRSHVRAVAEWAGLREDLSGDGGK